MDQAIRQIEELSNRSPEDPADEIEIYLASLNLEDAINNLELVAGQTPSASHPDSKVGSDQQDRDRKSQRSDSSIVSTDSEHPDLS